MLFSVVIPTFNRRDLLRETLASVWAQTCTDFEVIVVDNGSTDGTGDDLAAARDRLTAVFQDDQGPGGARNAGIARAQGEYIAFLDSDDQWFPWTLASIKQVIEESGSPAIVTGCVREFRQPSDLSDITAQPAAATRYSDFLASVSTPILVGSGSLVVRRAVAQASGGFTSLPINGEDHDWILRLGTAPGFAAVTSPVTLAWRRHEGGATANLARSIAGARYLIGQERAGQYPGGAGRAPDRLTFIGRHVRPVSFACVKAGAIRAGFELYAATFLWHLRLLRLRYLVAFPLVALAGVIRPARRAA
jgi:glycosyltransferase involved in cell wall biosynthesis